MKTPLQKLTLRNLALAIAGGGLGISFASILYDRELFCFGFAEGLIMLGMACALCGIGHWFKNKPIVIGGLMLLCLTAGLFLLLLDHIVV